MDYRMKKYIIILSFFFGCETYDVLQDNPLDSSNPNYEAPIVSITNLNEGDVLTSDNIDITLLGNENVSEYRYRLTSPTDSHVSMGDWSFWSLSNTLELEGLNEHEYSLSAQSRYLSESVSNEVSVLFTVDAVQPSSLLLYPKLVNSKIFTNFNVSLYAHDLPNISALDIIIEFNASLIDFKPEEGSKEYGDVNVLRDGVGKLNYTIGKYSNSGFSDNELILTAVFWPKGVSGTTTYIKIISATAKSIDGQTIEIVSFLQNQVRVDVR
jgi:hypothetical protein